MPEDEIKKVLLRLMQHPSDDVACPANDVWDALGYDKDEIASLPVIINWN